MNVELVRVKTQDGVRLHGALRRPAQNAAASGIDAVVFVHGVGSNFYGSVMMEALADAVLDAGMAALAINTRGHDGVSTASTDAGGRLAGAAYETVAECQADLAAWTDLLTSSGFQRPAWVGHSLGAIKVLYAAAKQPHPSQPKIVAISPPRLSYSRLMKAGSGSPFQKSLATATQLAENGQGRMLFQSTFPFPLVISANTFLDKYGPSERYNLLRFSPSVSSPVNFVFGGKELVAENQAFHQIDDDLKQLTWEISPRIEVIPGANHFYTGQFPSLCRSVLRCL